jgi:hypothetical protein
MATADEPAIAGGFAKLYGSRLAESSLLECAVATRWVFLYMLARADEDGIYRCATVAALARAANVTRRQATTAVAELEGPDPHSTTPDEDGRRIVRVRGGWRIVTHRQYRDYRSRRQVVDAARQRRARAGEMPEDDHPGSRTIIQDHSGSRTLKKTYTTEQLSNRQCRTNGTGERDMSHVSRPEAEVDPEVDPESVSSVAPEPQTPSAMSPLTDSPRVIWDRRWSQLVVETPVLAELQAEYPDVHPEDIDAAIARLGRWLGNHPDTLIRFADQLEGWVREKIGEDCQKIRGMA